MSRGWPAALRIEDATTCKPLRGADVEIGRTPHIHVKVHVGGRVVNTGQIFFADATSRSVYRTAAYRSRGVQDTSNRRDGLFRAAGGSRAIARLTRRRRATGYVGVITLAVARV